MIRITISERTSSSPALTLRAPQPKAQAVPPRMPNVVTPTETMLVARTPMVVR